MLARQRQSDLKRETDRFVPRPFRAPPSRSLFGENQNEVALPVVPLCSALWLIRREPVRGLHDNLDGPGLSFLMDGQPQTIGISSSDGPACGPCASPASRAATARRKNQDEQPEPADRLPLLHRPADPDFLTCMAAATEVINTDESGYLRHLPRWGDTEPYKLQVTSGSQSRRCFDPWAQQLLAADWQGRGGRDLCRCTTPRQSSSFTCDPGGLGWISAL